MISGGGVSLCRPVFRVRVKMRPIHELGTRISEDLTRADSRVSGVGSPERTGFPQDLVCICIIYIYIYIYMYIERDIYIYIYVIVSYYIISYHIISYYIIAHHIISYHIISYHIISYHIELDSPKIWTLDPQSYMCYIIVYVCVIVLC